MLDNNNENHQEVSSLSMPSEYIVFYVAERHFSVSISAVERIIHSVAVTPLTDSPANIEGIINIQGNIVPVISARRRFGLQDRLIELSDSFILVKSAGLLVALIIDRVHSVINIDEKYDFEEEEHTAGRTSSGEAIVFMGELVPVFNMDRLLSAEDVSFLNKCLSAAKGA